MVILYNKNTNMKIKRREHKRERFKITLSHYEMRLILACMTEYLARMNVYDSETATIKVSRMLNRIKEELTASTRI